jgi:hypothetical protein
MLKKSLLVALMLGLFTVAMVGCKASGEVGDTHTSAPMPR